MNASIEALKANLQKLIARFQAEKDYHLSRSYSEAQARIDFITPFFMALGWDVGNEAGLRHDDRDVLVEKGESDTTGRPDYSFRIGGQTRFFVEAKPPSEPLDVPKHIVQAKRYAWNTKQVFFVILTDFAEFRFYDASIKPDERTPDEGLLVKLAYTEYLKNVEKLWEFSRERVAGGSLDAMLPRDRRTQRLRIPVDEAFLDEMTGWREELARGIYKDNPTLTARQLNEVVQRLLDRIVFIRIAEDRRIIEKRQLADAAEEWQARGGKFSIFDWLRPLFERINDDFNGEIFKPNALLEGIQLDSEVLVKIIERLYPPKSPYRFDVIGVELLGSIYERYLGKTIRPTARTVRVEEKPEVRHAGGVYYTPNYIVDYIVKNTVGKIVEGKTPKQIEKIRILDPACGSGSFLIGAFQYLIDYHVRYLTEHPKEAHIHPLFPDLIGGRESEPRLSVIRKARILKNNLFGVDIDPQAVEITMMSLYLKALEGEKSQLPPKQHLLPELKYNIMCGNSLIGPEVSDQGKLFAEDEKDRINAFNWQTAFPEIMKADGFDAVIGNPPYIRVQTLQEWAPYEVEFYKRQYKAASSGSYDIYVVFVEKGLSVLKEDGLLGFILPHKFFNAKYGEPIRSVIASGKHLLKVVHFGDQQVFEGATNYTCLLFLTRAGSKQLHFTRVGNLEAWRATGEAVEGAIPASLISGAEWSFRVGGGAGLFERLGQLPTKLADVAARIFQGPITSADTVYLFKDFEPGKKKNTTRVVSKERGESVEIESQILKPVIRSGNIGRYSAQPKALVLFPYDVEGCSARLLSVTEMKGRYPMAWHYLTLKEASRGQGGGKVRGCRVVSLRAYPEPRHVGTTKTHGAIHGYPPCGVP